MTPNTTSPAGLALIQDHEGFRAEPIQLPDGAWVIGYGHVRAEAGVAVTETEAADLLTMDVAPIEQAVAGAVTQDITQSQFDALVSFTMSVGVEAFLRSQVLRRLNTGEQIAAACAMDAWRKSDVSGELEIVDALVRRRAAEKAMFLKDMPVSATPSVFVRAKLDHAASILGAPVKYSAAPEVGSIPVAQPKADNVVVLRHVLKSEPATETLLLTQVVANDASAEGGDEIVTAHAKPVARKIEVVDAALPIDRRIRRDKKRGKTDRKPFKLPAIRLPGMSRSFEHFGLAALMVFGLILVAIGGSMLFEGREDAIAVAGASAVAAPGIAAILISAYGLWFSPQPKAQTA